ncbi:MAG: hypothetical protein U0694_19140 [Anaerolineae bacterium]
MDKLIVDVSVDENHIATIKLPDVLPGNVRLEIRVLQNTPLEARISANREEIITALKTAGLLVENPLSEEELAALEGFEVSTEQEETELGRALADPDRSTLELVNEDREERF